MPLIIIRIDYIWLALKMLFKNGFNYTFIKPNLNKGEAGGWWTIDEYIFSIKSIYKFGLFVCLFVCIQ